MRFVKKRWKELECLNAKMRRSKVCYREKSSIQWRKGNRTSVVEMNQNSFIDKVYSLFTSHHSLIFNDMNFSRFTSHFSLKKAAFTLAEVLITLGIIGVVTAMTMPSLIQNYQEKATVTKLKKCYSLVSQAYVSILNDEGGSDTLQAGDDLEMMEKFGKYLKYQKTCGRNKGCFPNVTYKSVTGNGYSKWEDDTTDRSRAILTDGTLIMFNKSAMWRGEGNYLYAQIYVDINGFKGPNQLGRDFFYFYISPEKIVPAGAKALEEKNEDQKFTKNCIQQNGYACAAWVIYNENMDYLHCKDLSWDGKHSCKEKSSK
jgi:prepilin-type N-terminal cleavage/methylation domain-containing protein